MSPNTIAAYDPSVGHAFSSKARKCSDADTSPYEWGGIST
jgi:hypothetical protein